MFEIFRYFTVIKWLVWYWKVNTQATTETVKLFYCFQVITIQINIPSTRGTMKMGFSGLVVLIFFVILKLNLYCFVYAT